MNTSRFDKVKNPTFVEKLKRLLLSTNSTSETTDVDYNVDIERALESIKNGHFNSDEEAREILKKWGRK